MRARLSCELPARSEGGSLRREKRDSHFSRLSLLAPSVTRVVIFVSRAFRSTDKQGSLHMSRIDQSSPVTWTNFALCSYEKFQPGFRDEKRPEFLGTSSGTKFEKQSKHQWRKTKITTFAPIIAFATLKGVITVVQLDAHDVENTAGNARRCHLGCHNLSCFHPGKRAEVFIWQNFQPAYRDLGNRSSPPSHMNTSKILRRI